MLGPLPVLRAAEGVRISADSSTIRSTAQGRPQQCPREIRNFCWKGGDYSRQAITGSTLIPERFQMNSNDPIKQSLEQEKLDGK
ncbi:MAG: hypothetical protein RL514_1081 [Verrucomicrobiota bacterium]|jgi:hypothetical protein